MKVAIITALCIAAWVWTAGGVYADDAYSERDDQGRAYRCREYRHDLWFALGWGMLPPAWFICPFMTGFYEHGWQLKRPEYCKGKP